METCSRCAQGQFNCPIFVPLLSERGLPGLLSSLREPDDVCELQTEPSSSPELDESSELDVSSENGLLLRRVAFWKHKVRPN